LFKNEFTVQLVIFLKSYSFSIGLSVEDQFLKFFSPVWLLLSPVSHEIELKCNRQKKRIPILQTMSVHDVKLCHCKYLLRSQNINWSSFVFYRKNECQVTRWSILYSTFSSLKGIFLTILYLNDFVWYYVNKSFKKVTGWNNHKS
jgi:hypothetical protein